MDYARTVEEPLFRTKKNKPVEVPLPPVPLADSHGHLTSFRDISAAMALARAALVGVRLLVVPVDPADDVPDVAAFLQWFESTREEARTILDEAAARGIHPPVFPGFEDAPPLVDSVYFQAGVHPYGAQRFMEDPQVLLRLKELLQHPRCLAVGEFGLDFGPWNELPADVQQQAFRAQLRIAHELGLPVELHIRDAADDPTAQAHELAQEVLRSEGVPTAGCDLHCFTSDAHVMAPFVDLGCHIAFGGAATFARSTDIRAAAAQCPSDRMLLETDCPYMAPVPLRGQECEPAMVAFTANLLAATREEVAGLPRRQTYEALWTNAHHFFGLL